MKYFYLTNHPIVDNLLVQAEKTAKLIRACSYATKRRYTQAFRRLIIYAAGTYKLQRLPNIKLKHLISYFEYLKENGRSDKYIKTEVSGTIYFLRHIQGLKQQIPDGKTINRMIGLESTPNGRTDRTWSKDELENMVLLAKQHGKHAYAKCMQLIWYFGIRLDECTLTVHQAKQALMCGVLKLTNTKGGRIRKLTINEKQKNLLKSLVRSAPPGGYLVIPEEYWVGRIHIFEKSLQQFIIKNRVFVQENDRTTKAHNVPIDKRSALSLHGLRHAFASNYYKTCINQGCSTREAKKHTALVLGHNRSSVTDIYINSINKERVQNEKTL